MVGCGGRQQDIRGRIPETDLKVQLINDVNLYCKDVHFTIVLQNIRLISYHISYNLLIYVTKSLEC